MKQSLIFAVAISFVVCSCNDSSKSQVSADASASDTSRIQGQSVDSVAAEAATIYYSKATTNEETANKLKAFLVEKLKNDLSTMSEGDRRFSFYEIDLNDDQKNEYFISLEGGYFCGSGGCSYYLLNSDLSVNTYFTVTNPPVFRSAQKTNGWHDLILFGDYDENGGVKTFIHLKFDKAKNKYPGNPSVVKKIEMAPGGEDFIMWHEDFSQAKEFTF